MTEKNQPDIRICQEVLKLDEKGKEKKELINVGAIWKNTSKNGKVYYSIKVGNVTLVGFDNDPNFQPKK